MQGGMSLLQAVASAQGLEVVSDFTVVVVRTSNGNVLPRASISRI